MVEAIRQNLAFAFLYNAIGIPLAIFGLLNPLVAVCAMFASKPDRDRQYPPAGCQGG